MCEYRGGKPPCVMKVTVVGPFRAPSAGLLTSVYRSECEHTCGDPKDGELCPNRMKPGETLVEVRSDCDVQIHRQIWV
jgi:hypothetical protein